MKNVVIVGVGEVVAQIPVDLETASSPLDLMARAAQSALEDTGIENLSSKLDTIAVVRTFSDSGAPLKSPFGDPHNYPRAVAARIKADPKSAVYSATGGQVPQQLVNEFSNKIALGDCDAVMLVGAEALANQKALKRAKVKADWRDPTGGQLDERPAGIMDAFDIGHLHNEFTNIPALYTVMENARRAKLGLSREDYIRQCAELFENFSVVSHQNDHAMFPDKLSADEIGILTETNRAVTDLYTRAMTAKDGVNQGAALILMSEDKATELGINKSKWIYPVAGSDVTENTIPYRTDLSQSVAMKAAYDGVFSVSDLAVSDMDHLEIYSCFPVAVFAACEALGIDTNDPRGLTTTGGLPFFGGPGNNYAMHGIINTVRKLRANGKGYGLVGAMGGFLSKHCAGIYGCKAPDKGWIEADKPALAALVKSQETPRVSQFAEGRARIEGYAVEFGRKGPKRGYIVGRLEDGQRFIGSTDRADTETVEELLKEDPLNRTVYVTGKGPGNRFTFFADKTRALIPSLPASLEDEFVYCLVERRDHVLEVTINRPEARNSLTPEANFELEHIFNLFEKDQTLWVAILTGAGDKSFSAGNDLKYMGTGKPIWFPETGFAGLTHRPGRSKPVIAAVNGYAFGGGLEIALACDIIVADAAAQFALPEVKTGLIAAAGGLFRLPKVLPPHIAHEMILTGRAMKIDEALHYGMVNHKSDAGQAVEKAREIATHICAVSPTAVSASLEMMAEGADTLNPVTALTYPTKALPRVAASEDLQIGLMAFLTKQQAKWKNK